MKEYSINVYPILSSLEDATKKISKNSRKVVSAIDSHGKACGKIGRDLVEGLLENASPILIDFEKTMNKQAMLSLDKVI